MVGYSHLFKNFPQFVVIHTVKGFSIVNEAEVDVFLEFSFSLFVMAYILGFSNGSEVKNLPANAGDAGSITGSERSLGEGNGNQTSILAWEIPWTEEPEGLQSMGSQELDKT